MHTRDEEMKNFINNFFFFFLFVFVFLQMKVKVSSVPSWRHRPVIRVNSTSDRHYLPSKKPERAQRLRHRRPNPAQKWAKSTRSRLTDWRGRSWTSTCATRRSRWRAWRSASWRKRSRRGSQKPQVSDQELRSHLSWPPDILNTHDATCLVDFKLCVFPLFRFLIQRAWTWSQHGIVCSRRRRKPAQIWHLSYKTLLQVKVPL